jgi:NADPH-dependent curcumin reductase CurA
MLTTPEIPQTAREVRLVARPQGMPVTTDFELADAQVREPAEGEVLVRNLFLSVDPYMRGRMNDVKSYVPPFELGKVMDGGAVGEVVASTVDSHAAGDLVLHGLGWREWSLGPAQGFKVLPRGSSRRPPTSACWACRA